MPELPEVETIKRGLEKLIIGKKITAVEHDTPKSFPNAPHDVSEFLIRASVTSVRRRAKVLLIDLSTQYTLVIHLKMTGQVVFINKNVVDSKLYMVDSEHAHSTHHQSSTTNHLPPTNYHLPSTSEAPELRFGAGHPTDSLIGELPDRSTRVTIAFDDGSHLYFNDQRKFGWMKLFPTVEVPNINFMQTVGPEPLEADFTPIMFIERFRRRNNTTVKAALLDQTVIAGVGNIYADESLWGAKIHPLTRVRDISDEQLTVLFTEVRYVLELSIEKGGSTDRNYVNAEGKRGSYIDFARVFRREGQPCPRHPDSEIIKIRAAGRGTHLCIVCQDPPLL